jgi:hypothetical protein
MKVTQFRGRIPRLASRLLPDGHAEVCTNARLKSGDLESWRGNTVVDEPTKTGTVETIFPLDLYGAYSLNPGPVWLTYTSVDSANDTVRFVKSFAKAPSDDATTHRVFFNLGAYMRWTDINEATDGIGTDYPNVTYRLGVPTPTTAPGIASVQVYADPEIDATYDGTNLGGWTTSQFEPDDTQNVVGINSGEFELKANQLSGLDRAVYMVRDDGFGAAYYSRMRCKFRLTGSSSSPNDGYLNFVYGCDKDGAGNVIGLRISSSNTGAVRFGSQSSWDTPVTPVGEAMSGTPTLGTDYYLSVEITKNFTLNKSTEVTVTVKVGTTLGASDLFSKSFTSLEVTDGGGGPVIPPGFNDPGNGPVAKARYVIRPTVGDGNFWYGFSLTTYAGSNGPHISYVDDIDLALVGADAGDGVTVTRYAYTWINTKGEESAPSPLGPIVPDDPELTVNVDGIADASGSNITNYDIAGKRLYRAVTGDGVTTFRLVADQAALPNTVTTFSDDIATEDLSAVVLESQDWALPPGSPRDVCALANGILIVTTGNHAYPSQPYRPHAFVLSQAKSTDWPIVGCIAVENLAVLCTEESPYLMYGDDPASMTLDKLEQVAGCASKRGIVRWRNSVVYPSWDGLMSIAGKSATNITEEFFTRDEWAAYDPSSMICASVMSSRCSKWWV